VPHNLDLFLWMLVYCYNISSATFTIRVIMPYNVLHAGAALV